MSHIPVCFPPVLEVGRQAGEQQRDDFHPLVKCGIPEFAECPGADDTGQDLVDLVILLIAVVKLQIICKILRDRRVLEILADHVLVHRLSKPFVGIKHL